MYSSTNPPKSTKRNQYIDLAKQIRNKNISTVKKIRDLANAQKGKASQPIKVFLRIKPSTATGDSECIKIINNTTIDTINNEINTSHTFSHVFNQNSLQSEVYEISARPLIKSLLNGINGLFFAYGITNSGKTHTTTGNKEQPGILPRALAEIFHNLKNRSSTGSNNDLTLEPMSQPASQRSSYDFESTTSSRSNSVVDLHASNSNNSLHSLLEIHKNSSKQDHLEDLIRDAYEKLESTYEPETPSYNSMQVCLSYLEVYEDKLIDLLTTFDGNSTNNNVGLGNSLRIMTQEDGSVFVAGLKEVPVASLADALHLVNIGLRNRLVAETACNFVSSRSHSVLTLKIVKPHDNSIYSKLSIVDLAGSERQTRTHNDNKRLKEAGKINQSLLQLGRCLVALRHNQSITADEQTDTGGQMVVPFRDSKITHLLQDYFCGYGNTVMLMTASDIAADFDETCHALKYAAIASQISVQPNAKQEMYQNKKYEEKKREMKKKLDELHENIASKVLKKRHSDEISEGVEAVNSDNDEEKVNDDEYITQLLNEQYQLRAMLVEMEERCVLVESQVRREVVEEAESIRHTMEVNYDRNMNDLRNNLETKFSKKLALREKQFQRQLELQGLNAEDTTQASSDNEKALSQAIDELNSQIEEKSDIISKLELKNVEFEVMILKKVEQIDSLQSELKLNKKKCVTLETEGSSNLKMIESLKLEILELKKSISMCEKLSNSQKGELEIVKNSKLAVDKHLIAEKKEKDALINAKIAMKTQFLEIQSEMDALKTSCASLQKLVDLQNLEIAKLKDFKKAETINTSSEHIRHDDILVFHNVIEPEPKKSRKAAPAIEKKVEKIVEEVPVPAKLVEAEMSLFESMEIEAVVVEEPVVVKKKKGVKSKKLSVEMPVDFVMPTVESSIEVSKPEETIFVDSSKDIRKTKKSIRQSKEKSVEPELNNCSHVNSIYFEKYSQLLSTKNNFCQTCSSYANWICMGCGNCSCGDTSFKSHAANHADICKCPVALELNTCSPYCFVCEMIVTNDSRRSDIAISKEVRQEFITSKKDAPKETKKLRSKRLSVMEESVPSEITNIPHLTRHTIKLKQALPILSPVLTERVNRLQELSSPMKFKTKINLDDESEKVSNSKENQMNLSNMPFDADVIPVVKRKLGANKRGKASEDAWLDLMDTFDPFQKKSVMPPSISSAPQVISSKIRAKRAL